jgi:non-ribosomal peptide synthetase component F
VIGGREWASLAGEARARRVTPAVTLCSAFAATLACWSGCDHFTLNVTTYRRPPIHPDINRVVGDFTSLELLEIRCPRDQSFAELALNVRSTLWSDFEHGDIDGVWVLRELSMEHDRPVTAPVVFTSLLGLAGSSSPFLLEELGRRVYTITQTPQVWLDHQVVQTAAGVELAWDSVEQLFDGRDIERAFGRYATLVGRLGNARNWEPSVGELLGE